MYQMTLNKADAQLIERILDQMPASTFKWVNDGSARIINPKLECKIGDADLYKLADYLDAIDDERADGLLGGIIETCDINEFAHIKGFNKCSPLAHQTGAWAKSAQVEVVTGLTHTIALGIISDGLGFTLTAKFEKQEVKTSYTVTFSDLYQFKEFFDYYYNLIQRIAKLVI